MLLVLAGTVKTLSECAQCSTVSEWVFAGVTTPGVKTCLCEGKNCFDAAGIDRHCEDFV